MSRKAIFDAVRAVAPTGLFNDPGNVLALDNLLDAFGVPRETAGDWVELASPLVERFEGLARLIPGGKVEAYPDPGTDGVPWTIGIGSTTDEDGAPIAQGTVWPVERARKRFAAHLAEFGAGVDRLIAGKPTTAAQKAAMASLAYNIGLDAFGRSTVLKKHRAGDYSAAADAFALWNKAAGRVLPGLVRRRKAEADLYRSGL